MFSLNSESTATLLRTFVTSCIDYCNVMLAWAPKTMTDKLQCVVNDAARVASGTRKFDVSLSVVHHSELQRLDIPERIIYKLGVMTYGCHHGKAPQYLADCYMPVSDVPARQRLRSSSRHHLVVPRHRLSTYCQRAFSVAGPSVWNSLLVELQVLDISIGSFRQSLKTWLFSKC